MDLAVFVHHQPVHVFVGSDIHGTAIDFRPGCKRVQEQFVTSLYTVAVDYVQGRAVKGCDDTAYGIHHEIAVECHPHSERHVRRKAGATLGLLIIEQFIR
ncbi:hypothetical protein D3C81_1138440 [compost metagenome]